MWLVGLVAAILFLLGFVMWLFGVDGTTTLTALTVIAAACFYVFLAACIHLVAIIFAANGHPWVLVTPFVFLALVAVVHWRALRR